MNPAVMLLLLMGDDGDTSGVADGHLCIGALRVVPALRGRVRVEPALSGTVSCEPTLTGIVKVNPCESCT